MRGEDLLRAILVSYSKCFLKQKETGRGGCRDREQTVLVFDARSVPFSGCTVISKESFPLSSVLKHQKLTAERYQIRNKIKGERVYRIEDL